MIKLLAKKRGPKHGDIRIPRRLPPLNGLAEQDEQAAARAPRTWLWTLIAALIVVSLMAYVIALGILAVYHGLKDRAMENRQIAQEHYALGLEHMEAQNYELAIAEFDLALRHDGSLREASAYLREAKEMARAQVTPTSETRQDAAELLYQEAVSDYESGNLENALATLDELQGLDPEYQADNVKTMQTTAHYQLGLNAVAADKLDEASRHFESVLQLKPGDKQAQDQLNLVRLYTAALNYWERDWAATIQALKGLYALAPDYKDVKNRLHDAYLFYAQILIEQGNWCRAADQFAAAITIWPLETTVDARDEARIRCQATAAAPPPTPTAQATARPRVTPTVVADATRPSQETPQPEATAVIRGTGQIAFAGFDAARQQHDIYLLDLAQGDARLLQANASQPAFDPSSRRLAFRNLDPLHLGLGILDVSDNTLWELTAHAEDSTPTWSSTAEQIVFASSKHGDRKWRLYVTSPGELRGEGAEWAYGRLPAWSRDGSRIAYQGCDVRGDNCGVWLMQPGGFNPARLTSDSSDTAPAWSPDGSRVAFVSARDGNWEIYVVEITTGTERRLTDHNASDVAPAWSPDGSDLAFLSQRDGAWAVYILHVESGRLRRLMTTGDAYPDPLSERLSWVP